MTSLAWLFAKLYDELDEGEFRANVAQWTEDPGFWSLVALIHGHATAGDLSAHLSDTGDNPDRQRLIWLVGLDRALQDAQPRSRTRPSGALAPIARELALNGCLDVSPLDGVLLPRVSTRATIGPPEHKRDMFKSVLRVSQQTLTRCELVAPPEPARLNRSETASGIKVACVPLIADPAELRFAIVKRGENLRYQIRPRGLAATRTRVRLVVHALNESGAMIAVIPELTLSPTLLACWREELSKACDTGSSLLLVLAGTGALDTEEPSANTAVLLDARTGGTLLTQEKLYRFDLTRDTLNRWGLRALLGDGPLLEDMRPGRKLQVLEAGGGVRLAILICEDCARQPDLLPDIRELGVSHVLMPVFSRPLREHRWENTAAAAVAREAGATVIVSNSLVISTITGGAGATALAAWPGRTEPLLGSAAEPDQLVSFTLHSDGLVSLS